MAVVTVEQVNEQARQYSLGRALADIVRRAVVFLAAVLFGLGWAARKALVATAFTTTWVAAAVVLGWRAAAPPK